MAYLTDGYQTLISFGAASLAIKEKEVKPPALDGNGYIDITTMRNAAWRTMAPKHLVTADEVTILCEWDPIIYSTITTTLLNKNTTLTIVFPDGHSLVVWGFITKADPSSLKEGEFPTMDIKFQPSNVNSGGAETGPAYT